MLLSSPQLHSSSRVSTRDALVEQSNISATTFFSKVSLLETPGTLSGKESELNPLHELSAISELKMSKLWQKTSYCESHHILNVTGSLLRQEVQVIAQNIFYFWKSEWDRKS